MTRGKYQDPGWWPSGIDLSRGKYQQASRLQLPRPHFHHHAGGPVVSRRTLMKYGMSAAAAGTLVGLERSTPFAHLRRIDDTQTLRPIRQLTLVGTDGWISMPSGSAPAGPAWPDPFAPAHRDLYIFGFAVAGRFETPDRLTWADYWNGAPGTATQQIGGLAALKNRANLSAPILYFHEGDDIRITMWNTGLLNRPDIVDAHTIHWHGFPNQIPYFDGVPNGSLSVPIGSNLVYRYLPYRGMAGSYMWHCHVSDAEHVQMGLQGIVFIRPYQNYGVNAQGIPQARATGATSGPLGYAFNDGLQLSDPNSTAYDREFAFILDELDARIHYDDSHFQEQDFSFWAPKFATMNGRAWPDTIAGNWDISVGDPDATANKYNIATVDQCQSSGGMAPYLTKDFRLGLQPWTSLIQANAGETVLLRFSNLGYNEHSMELSGLPFKVIGMDAKNLLQGRDSYFETPNPDSVPFSNLSKRDNISFTTYRTAVGPAESRDILVKIPLDAGGSGTTPNVFEFFDRNEIVNRNATDGGALVGGMRTQLHVFAPGVLPPQNYPQQVFNPGFYA
jgi:FtsP/CotA-like multicopper oxidase with cupredoxin domain